jgi:hypothetical protein
MAEIVLLHRQLQFAWAQFLVLAMVSCCTGLVSPTLTLLLAMISIVRRASWTSTNE